MPTHHIVTGLDSAKHLEHRTSFVYLCKMEEGEEGEEDEEEEEAVHEQQ